MSRMSDLDALVQAMIYDAETSNNVYCWRRVFGYPNVADLLCLQDADVAVILANGCELKAVPISEVRVGATAGTIERLGDDVLVLDPRGLRDRLWSVAEITSLFGVPSATNTEL